MHTHRRPTPEQAARNRALARLREEVAGAAAAAGLTLTVSVIRHTRTQHWQFRRDGVVVLHWWPTCGKWWEPDGGAKGVEADAAAMVERARTAAERGRV